MLHLLRLSERQWGPVVWREGRRYSTGSNGASRNLDFMGASAGGVEAVSAVIGGLSLSVRWLDEAARREAPRTPRG